jgi:hypothetical protein
MIALTNENGLKVGVQLPLVTVCPIPNCIDVPPSDVVFTSPPKLTVLVKVGAV